MKMNFSATVLLAAVIILLTWLVSMVINWLRFVRRVNDIPGPRGYFKLRFSSIPKDRTQWESQRTLITPAFHIKVIESHQEVFVRGSELLMTKLQQHARKDEFNMMPYLMNFAFDVICGAAIGVNLQEREEFYSELLTAANELNDLTFKRSLPTWQSWNILFKLSADGRRFQRNIDMFNAFFDKAIREMKSELSCNNISNTENDIFRNNTKNVALQSLLLQNEGMLSDKEIRDHVKTTIIAGYETTLASLSWTLFLLGKHKDVQLKVYEEQQSIFHGSDKHVSTEDVKKMKYLKQVIEEAARLYPPVPVVLRQIEEDVSIGDYVVPAGVVVNINIYHLHRCADQFPDPEIFNPDNFLPERIDARHPFSYLPFSAGPRNCIGKRFTLKEQTTLLSYILRKYEVHSTQTKETMAPVRSITLRPGNGLWVKIRQRD
ncbi:cytochrome P450 4C1-like isoform X2 [Bacillus rossius redtenbacheri]|uniref:cytochrome P450 4C1-like isoform X2 n=1 Tax=Bacillus rossius redtenbacheri TaxID=93214 RepID=UPI002FDD0033